MKKILLLMLVALPFVFISCGDDKDEPAATDGHKYVDLGLPSGTLWATCNIGAKNPEEYGDYFAWGETEPKDDYRWTTYKWLNGSTMTKYCTNRSYGTVDNKTELDPGDDAAYVNWGPSWRMPSKEQQRELLNKCTWTWTTRNGVNGYLVTGPSGNTIFLPAASCRWGSTLAYTDYGSYGYYWSRSLYSSDSEFAYSLSFRLVVDDSIEEDINLNYDHRDNGCPVRAVRVSQD